MYLWACNIWKKTITFCEFGFFRFPKKFVISKQSRTTTNKHFSSVLIFVLFSSCIIHWYIWMPNTHSLKLAHSTYLLFTYFLHLNYISSKWLIFNRLLHTKVINMSVESRKRTNMNCCRSGLLLASWYKSYVWNR